MGGITVGTVDFIGGDVQRDSTADRSAKLRAGEPDIAITTELGTTTMPVSIVDLAEAREITAWLLDQLGLDAYLYEIQPLDGEWELKLECAVESGWESLRLPVRKDLLLASRNDPAARQRLLESWREQLAGCKRRSS